MKELFIMGGTPFMSALLVLLIISIAWVVYHFIVAYNSKQTDKVTSLQKLGYGKSIGLFALLTGVLGQMIGLNAMCDALYDLYASGNTYRPDVLFNALRATTIVTISGILIYLLSILLWFVATMLVEQKYAKPASA